MSGTGRTTGQQLTEDPMQPQCLTNSSRQYLNMTVANTACKTPSGSMKASETRGGVIGHGRTYQQNCPPICNSEGFSVPKKEARRHQEEKKTSRTKTSRKTKQQHSIFLPRILL